MNKFIFIPVILVVVACSNTKQTAEDLSDGRPGEDVMPARHTGIVSVDFKDQGCDLLIKMTSKSEYEYLIPVQLDTKYRKPGLELKFDFVPSRAPQGDCKTGQMALLENVGYASE